ncbi:hypothetical protein [Chryseobacterium daecheongense]|uniref:C1q domain-containing protein n=1 Tax=Chryseobacterium daecheongense TaxID=192389 RepID=A0A3N0VSV4_9FLAO|nr:hypothetical protein [Chryseobacterium daecheongense]ROH95886.1 hypothetical protein EGI05_15320 [Chryseobacterium daecheongense]TDX91716.1 hypothetical protein BCF50_2854 [Chryseobacterium daecheongense]
MRKNIFLMIVLLSFTHMFSQIGIQTPNPIGILHIDGQKDNPVTGTTFTPAQQSNDVIITNTGRVGAGTLSPAVKMDVRNSGNGAIGFGTSTLTAAAADEGAVRYNNGVEYSNGNEWLPLLTAQPATNKVIVIASKTNNNVKLITPAAVTTTTGLQNRQSNYLVSWTKAFESNSGTSFNATTGVFTAPHNGVYVASFTTDLSSLAINYTVDALNPIQIEAIWQLYDNTAGLTTANIVNTVKCVNTMSSNSIGNIDAGSNCTASFYMTAGQRLMPYIWFNLNNSDVANFSLNNTGGYNNLTIAEQ